MAFHNKGHELGGGLSLDDTAWEALNIRCQSAYQTIDEALKQIERAAEIGNRQAQHMMDMAQFQQLLSLRDLKQGAASLPCHTLPLARNTRFFGRQDVIEQVQQHLKPTITSDRLKSIALHGLGGVGKTQIALEFAYRNLPELDAIFWIASEDTLSVQQSFSRVAVNGLKLPGANHGAHQGNIVLVLDWLQKTTAKWLVIFDNVDTTDVLDDCWPAANHGSVLVTTRDELVATIPIDRGLEVPEFSTDEGADFLLKMTPSRRTSNDESVAARQVAAMLGGFPLALNQMAAVVNARKDSIPAFFNLYSENQRRLHREKKKGSRYIGYNYALDTVWELSFGILDGDARAVLGVLSFLSADAIPAAVLRPTDSSLLPSQLAFCRDEFSFGDVFEQLNHHSLVKRNIDHDTYRMHRLVQAEYMARIENKQQAFEAAVKLLLDKFPSQRESTFDDDEWLLFDRYVPQVLALMRNFNNSQKTPSPLTSSMDLVTLLTNAANAVHDNDTANVVKSLLDTAGDAFNACPEPEKDRLLWAQLQNLKGMYNLKTADFVQAEEQMRESLEIRRACLSADDLLVHLAYCWLSMSIAAQGKYQEGLDLMLIAGKILDGPAGGAETRKMVWRYNTSRNYYCMGSYAEAEALLIKAVAEADNRQSWYNQVYGHMTMVSLRIRMKQIAQAKQHSETAKSILESAGSLARFSWISSQCAYVAGWVARAGNDTQEAIDQSEKSIAIGKLTNVPTGVLCRCTHAYSEALKMDPSRSEEAEKQRLEARRLRSQLPGGGGNLDDESDEAFDMLVRMDQR